MTRPLWQIANDLTRLRAEKRAAKSQMFKPGHVRSRSFKPEGEGQRQPRERDPGYLAFLRRQPCAAAHVGGCSGPVQAAHIRYRVAGIQNSAGMGVKNHDRYATGLCAGHHAQQHHVGDEARFWQSIGRNAYETAASLFAEYQSGGPSKKALAERGGDV